MSCNIQCIISYIKKKISSFFSWIKKSSDKTVDTITHYLPIGKLVATLMFGSVLLFIVLSVFAPFISAFGSITVHVAIALFALWIIDKFVLIGINTVEELKKGNIAYALFWIGLAIIIHAAISAS